MCVEITLWKSDMGIQLRIASDEIRKTDKILCC